MSHMVAKPVRTLFLSDVHLGSKHAQTGQCLKFLRGYEPEQVYLVGDFIDGWRTHHGWNWTPECGEIMDYFERLMRSGTKVFYVPGNHDSFLRQIGGHDLILQKFAGKFADIHVADEFVFETAHGWRFLITHGDLFDIVETQAQWVSKATSIAYDYVLSFNRLLNLTTGRGNKNPYGACALLKSQVKRAVRFMSEFETSIMHHARSRDCEGIICGHIHTPKLVHHPHLLYCNTGDWVENCTGLIEHFDGTLSLESAYGKSTSLALMPHERASTRSATPCSHSPPQTVYEDDLLHAAGT